MFELWHSIMKCFLIVTASSVHAKSILSHFETSCNASQFADLENLIGSVHRYAPAGSVYIYVRDMNLLKGQKMLLERYQNVKIISSTDIILEKTQKIDVVKELVVINGKYDIRHSNGKLLYVDSIRKRLQLAIVIPFIRSQLSKVKYQLNLSELYIPCENSFDSVDLIFYHNEGRYSSLETEIRQLKYTNKCYRNIRYLSVNLTTWENEYPRGSFIMWRKLLLDNEDNSVLLRAYGYTHFFIMEPDTRPIRPFWLDAIVHQITDDRDEKLYFSTRWWMSGSVYRGSKPIGSNFLHINGNALYHLSSGFIDYVRIFTDIYETESQMSSGYDLAIFSLLLGNNDLGKRYWHKFRFSDFIQNCWHTGCEGSDQLNNTQFIFNNPNTYLIHGTLVKEKKTDQGLSNLYKILLACIVLKIIMIWQCQLRHRQSKVKRIILKLFYFWIPA